MPIRLAGRGRAVVGGVLSGSLARREVEELVIDGFFPLTPPDAAPRKSARAGLQEWGLPFASEAEVSRHLAAFVRQHAGDRAVDGDQPLGRPDAILFNGGALKPAIIRDRLRDLLASWGDGTAPDVLRSTDLDLAVARGAAYYGLVRRGLGVRIGGGSARAYYLGLAAPGAADAGRDPGALHRPPRHARRRRGRGDQPRLRRPRQPAGELSALRVEHAPRRRVGRRRRRRRAIR